MLTLKNPFGAPARLAQKNIVALHVVLFVPVHSPHRVHHSPIRRKRERRHILINIHRRLVQILRRQAIRGQ
jgi:hypothetical protein